MTVKTPTSEAQRALAAAEADLASTDKAIRAARARIPAAQQELSQAEADVTAALTPGTCKNKADLQNARARFEKARDDIEWAHIEIQSAETAHSQTSAAAARAQRAVTAEEYLVEHQRFNDPMARENNLLDQLTQTVAELLALLPERDRLHHRLTQEYDLFPADEKQQLAIAIPPGRLMTTRESYADFNPWNVPVHNQAIAEAIKAGIAEAAKAGNRPAGL